LVQQHSQARQAEAARRRQEALAAVTVQLAEARNLHTQAQQHPLGDPARFRQAQAAAAQAVKLIDASEAAEELRPEATALVQTLGEEATAADRDRVLLAALLEVRGPREELKLRSNTRGLEVEVAEPGADERFREAFKQWGLDLDAMPVAEAAARLRRRPAAVVAEVIAALDEWASGGRRGRPGSGCRSWRRRWTTPPAPNGGVSCAACWRPGGCRSSGRWGWLGCCCVRCQCLSTRVRAATGSGYAS
jgi:hypothetical protein